MLDPSYSVGTQKETHDSKHHTVCKAPDILVPRLFFTWCVDKASHWRAIPVQWDRTTCDRLPSKTSAEPSRARLVLLLAQAHAHAQAQAHGAQWVEFVVGALLLSEGNYTHGLLE